MTAQSIAAVRPCDARISAPTSRDVYLVKTLGPVTHRSHLRGDAPDSRTTSGGSRSGRINSMRPGSVISRMSIATAPAAVRSKSRAIVIRPGRGRTAPGSVQTRARRSPRSGGPILEVQPPDEPDRWANLRAPLIGRNLGDDQGIRTRQDPSIPTRPEALSCRDWFHWTSRRPIDAVRDEEVVGSNPATPTYMQVRGRFLARERPLLCVDAVEEVVDSDLIVTAAAQQVRGFLLQARKRPSVQAAGPELLARVPPVFVHPAAEDDQATHLCSRGLNAQGSFSGEIWEKDL